jgi:hypothetical protein
MLLKAHVRFLGGRTAAMRYGYPTWTIGQSSDARDPMLAEGLSGTACESGNESIPKCILASAASSTIPNDLLILTNFECCDRLLSKCVIQTFLNFYFRF